MVVSNAKSTKTRQDIFDETEATIKRLDQNKDKQVSHVPQPELLLSFLKSLH
jgi:hypothetical protein